MINKSILQLLISIIIVFVLASAFSITILYINKNIPAQEDLSHKVNFKDESLAHTIAYYLLRPLLESSLEHYIKEHRLHEYLMEQEDNITFHDITEGTGNKAYCGQEVTLHLSQPPSQKTSQVTLKIGGDEFTELALGIIGMQEGGERVVLTHNGTDIKSYYVKLAKIIDEQFMPKNDFMIFDNIKDRTGKKVKCGDNISIKYNIRTYNGKIQVKDQILKFKIGEKKVPHAIEIGVIGMITGNNRTLIAFPDSLTTTDQMLVKNIEFDKKNLSIIDLSISDDYT